MKNPKLALIPSGYKSGKVYSVLPVDGVGDFDFSRNTESSRVNKEGLIETVSNNVPRLDWLNSDCPSLLLEPQRINLQVRSEEFDNSSWAKSRSSIIANNGIAPTGELTADKLTGTGTGASYLYDGVTLTNGVTYTISIFVKPIINISSFAINVFGGVGTAYFNLVDKNVNSISGDFTSAKIIDYGNGWLRCIGTLTLSSSTGAKNIGYGLLDFNGDQFFLFGAQVEQGSYPTSYIKTIGSAVTRQRDFLLNGGNFDLFNVSELSLFVDVTNFKRDATSYITLTNGVNSPINMVRVDYTQNSILIRWYNNGTNTFSYNINSVITNQRNKLLLSFGNNQVKTYFNGILKNTTSISGIPNGFDSLSFTNRTETGGTFQGKVHEARFYDRVLTQDESIELTTI